MPPTGLRFEQDWIAVLTFEGDKIVAIDEFHDNYTLLIQLGLAARSWSGPTASCSPVSNVSRQTPLIRMLLLHLKCEHRHLRRTPGAREAVTAVPLNGDPIGVRTHARCWSDDWREQTTIGRERPGHISQ